AGFTEMEPVAGSGSLGEQPVEPVTLLGGERLDLGADRGNRDLVGDQRAFGFGRHVTGRSDLGWLRWGWGGDRGRVVLGAELCTLHGGGVLHVAKLQWRLWVRRGGGVLAGGERFAARGKRQTDRPIGGVGSRRRCSDGRWGVGGG